MILVLPLALLLFWLVAEWSAARWLSGSCGEGCKLRIDAIKVRPSLVRLEGLALSAGSEEEERWDLSARTLELEPRWGAVLKGSWEFEALRARGLKVELHEGEKEKAPREKHPLPSFAVGKIAAEGASFRYHRRKAGAHGSIELDQIELEGGPIGTAPAYQDRPSSFRTKARLEGSGRVELDVNARFFQKDPGLKLRLELVGQDLGGMNRYFEPMDQIKLKGNLVRSEARLTSHGQGLEATVDVRYRGLDVEFLSGRERSGFSAFLGNLLKGLGLDDENIDEERSLARGQVSLARKAGESIVSFVLRGLKEAAMKVAAS